MCLLHVLSLCNSYNVWFTLGAKVYRKSMESIDETGTNNDLGFNLCVIPTTHYIVIICREERDRKASCSSSDYQVNSIIVSTSLRY